MSDTPLLREGARGEAVRVLHRRLRLAGFDPNDIDEYGAGTVAAVRAFQTARKLRIDGICGPETWGALEESAFSLGDRLLCRRAPMLRGDDVVDLQTRLNALGYDAGRSDGIFGPQTEDALVAFQRDAAVAVDRICGPETIAALARLGAPGTGSVAATRERDALRRGALRFDGVRIVVSGGSAGPAGSLAEALRARGAEASVESGDGDPVGIAARVNELGADLFVHLTESEQNLTQCAFFEGISMRSEGGFQVATGISAALAGIGVAVADPVGRTSRLLRETRMPAVICELADPAHPAVADAIADGIHRTFANTTPG